MAWRTPRPNRDTAGSCVSKGTFRRGIKSSRIEMAVSSDMEVSELRWLTVIRRKMKHQRSLYLSCFTSYILAELCTFCLFPARSWSFSARGRIPVTVASFAFRAYPCVMFPKPDVPFFGDGFLRCALSLSTISSSSMALARTRKT